MNSKYILTVLLTLKQQIRQPCKSYEKLEI